MSLKSIEMQIAIPRTNEAGQLQNQLANKSTQDQTALAASALKTAEQERHRGNKVEETADMIIREGSDKKHRQEERQDANHKKSPRERDDLAGHPYKGHHIDLSL